MRALGTVRSEVGARAGLARNMTDDSRREFTCQWYLLVYRSNGFRLSWERPVCPQVYHVSIVIVSISFE